MVGRGLSAVMSATVLQRAKAEPHPHQCPGENCQGAGDGCRQDLADDSTGRTGGAELKPLKALVCVGGVPMVALAETGATIFIGGGAAAATKLLFCKLVADRVGCIGGCCACDVGGNGSPGMVCGCIAGCLS